MRKLSDTIARLAALRASQQLRSHAPGVDRLEEISGFGSNPGALRAKIYRPANLPKQAPLVVVLHGCTQTAAAYDHGAGWSRLADMEGFALLFPEQQRANNPNLCFNWFLPGDTTRGAGEALSIFQMVEFLVRTQDLDRKRVFITGLSAGGAMTSVMLATYPEVFAGGAIIAGLPYGSASTIPQAFDRMRGHGGPSSERLADLVRNASAHKGPWPTISVWHGTADATVSASNALDIVGQWRRIHGIQGETGETMSVDGQMRSVWRDRTGRAVIEQYLIAGMGHGTPLGVTRGSRLGAPGPFMLDVGLASTEHIARFWGIARSVDETARAVKSGAFREGRESGRAITEEARPVTRERGKAPAGASGNVGKIIEDALRAAGLMR